MLCPFTFKDTLMSYIFQIKIPINNCVNEVKD